MYMYIYIYIYIYIYNFGRELRVILDRLRLNVCICFSSLRSMSDFYWVSLSDIFIRTVKRSRRPCPLHVDIYVYVIFGCEFGYFAHIFYTIHQN